MPNPTPQPNSFLALGYVAPTNCFSTPFPVIAKNPFNTYLNLLAILITALFLLTPIPSHAQTEFPPSGTLYTVNGYPMHLHCTGSGSPTVILEAGVGGFSLNWSWVQPELAQSYRVCSYDRPGYGWSQPVDRPFSVPQATDDLLTLLDAAQIDPPYLLVGHSFGGVILRDFHARQPESVLGMVLLDAVAPQMSTRITNYPQALTAQMEGLRLISAVARLALLNGDDPTLPIPTNVPPDVAEVYIAKLLEPNFFEASYTEARYLANDLPAFDLPDDLGDLPLIVITHGIPETRSFLGAPMTPEQAAEAERIWLQLQTELSQLSTRGTLIIAKDSQHNIQFDQPDLVIESVLALMEQADEAP